MIDPNESSNPNPPSLQGRRVLIVGGTGGIGHGVAQAAADAGALVVIAGRRPENQCRAIEGNADHVERTFVDITDEASVRALFVRYERLDHLIVTAGPSAGGWASLAEQNTASAKAYMDAKFFGSWLCAKYGAPRLSKDGSITFLTGGTAVRPRERLAIVTAAFSAVEALARSLAVELGPVRVNVIRPGFIDSDLWSFLDAGERETIRGNIREAFPARRVGQVEDVGHAACFLMTNPFVTGVVLEVSGGETLVDQSWRTKAMSSSSSR